MFVLQLFDSKSPLMAALGALLDWFLLSLLTWICSVPVITAGPAWTALYGVMANRIGDNSPPAFRSYLTHVRRLFRPALTNWLLFFIADVFCQQSFTLWEKCPAKYGLCSGLVSFFWRSVSFLREFF